MNLIQRCSQAPINLFHNNDTTFITSILVQQALINTSSQHGVFATKQLHKRLSYPSREFAWHLPSRIVLLTHQKNDPAWAEIARRETVKIAIKGNLRWILLGRLVKLDDVKKSEKRTPRTIFFFFICWTLLFLSKGLYTPSQKNVSTFWQLNFPK